MQFQRVRRSSIFAAKLFDDVINFAPDLRVEAGGGLIEEKLNGGCVTPTECLQHPRPRGFPGVTYAHGADCGAVAVGQS